MWIESHLSLHRQTYYSTCNITSCRTTGLLHRISCCLKTHLKLLITESKSGISISSHMVVKPRLHDTTYCQTGFTSSQPVVSCKRGLTLYDLGYPKKIQALNITSAVLLRTRTLRRSGWNYAGRSRGVAFTWHSVALSLDVRYVTLKTLGVLRSWKNKRRDLAFLSYL